LSYQSPAERRLGRRRLARLTLAVTIGFLIACALDYPAFYLLTERLPTAEPVPGAVEGARVVHEVNRDRFLHQDWYRLLRVLGSLWTWGVVSLGLILIDRARPGDPWSVRDPFEPYRRGAILLGSAVAAGVLAELLKLVLGRERPIDEGVFQGYVFKPLLGALTGSGGNLGLPSSHAAVAFGACGALALLHAPVRTLALLLAAGCAWSRLAVGAHWLSDVYLGAAVGLASASAVHAGLGGRPPSGAVVRRSRLG